MNRLHYLLLAGMLLAPGSQLWAQNLIPKADFGTKTNLAVAPGDFTTGLTANTNTNNSSNASSYVVTDNPSTFNSGFGGTDHTTGGSPGVLLAVDGPTDVNTIVWQKAVAVQPSRTYTFSYWQRNLVDGSPAKLQLQYQGTNTAATVASPSSNSGGTATSAGLNTAAGFQATSSTTWQQVTYTINTAAGDTQLTLTLRDLVTQSGGNDFGLDDFSLVQANTGGIAGTVFEDVNYGGGVGRPLATANSSAANSGFTASLGRSGAQVELYSTAGLLVTSTTTDGNGFYNFPTVAAGTTYTVRVVSSSVSSARAGYASGLLPVVTYVGGVSDQVGGPKPNLPDAPANTSTTTTLNSLTTNAQAVEAANAVSVGTSGTATGVDFGFNFDLVVNTQKSGQGSLQQFILNSNALGDEGKLAQAGSYLGQVVGSSGTTALPSATETSIFMIADGKAHNGLRDAGSTGGAPNLLSSNGVALLNFASATTGLTALSGPSTIINGWTQSYNVSNANNVNLGQGGGVGVGGGVLPQLNGPEVQLYSNVSLRIGLSLTGNNEGITGLSIYGFGNGNDSDANADILVSGNSASLVGNVVGTPATNFDLSGNSGSNYSKGDGIRATGGTGLRIANNLIGFHASKGITLLSGATGATISQNEVRSNSLGDVLYAGLNVQSSGSTVSNNLFINNIGPGLDGLSSTGSNVWSGNTVTNNGYGSSSTAPRNTAGVRAYGATNTIKLNLIYNNYGAGIMVNSASTNTTISQNAIYGNGSAASTSGAAASGEIGIDLQRYAATNNADNSNVGSPAYVTTNNSTTAAVASTSANGLFNYPILQTAQLQGTTLTVTGIVTKGSTVELFLASPNSVTTSGATAGNNFGQGSSFLLSQVVSSGTATNYTSPTNGFDQGSGSGVSFTLSLSLNSLTADQRKALTTAGAKLTSTATLAGTGTSEFSGNVAVTSIPTAYDVTNLKIGSVSSATAAVVALNPGLTVPQAASDPVSSIASFTVSPPATNGTLYTDSNGNNAITGATNIAIANIGNLYFRPATNYTGNVTFSFTATNANGVVSNSATYTIPVVASNSFVANDDGLDAPANQTTSGNVVLNDANPSNSTSFTASVITQPTNGTVKLNNDGSYSYTPNTNYTGSDSFQYQICTSSTNCSNTATVAINVFDPSLVCSSATGPNLIQNPGFESGNDGSFTSAYQYVSPSANASTSGGNSGLVPETTYAVDVNANSYHRSFQGLGRGGSGNFMIVNGAANQSKVYSQVVNVTPNRYYNFSGWAQSINGTSPALLGFVINGKSASVATTLSATTQQYQQFSGVWYSGSSRTATFEVRDINRTANGNDFGLDDLYFGTCNVNLQALNVTNSPGIPQNTTTNIAPLDATLTSSGVSIASFVMQSLPTFGSLLLGGPNGSAVVAGQVIPYAQRSTLYYVTNGTAGTATFTYTALDSEGAGSSNTATYQIPVNTGPLPVVLAAFTARPAGPAAQLAWMTASEVANDHFEVERSASGLAGSFVAIGRVAGQGSKATATSYAFLDRNAAAMGQLVYYRLRQVDADGTSVYSLVRAVSFVPAGSVPLAVYPNPTAGPGTSLDLRALPSISSYQVRLLDATGRQVRQWELAGGQPQLLPVTDLAAGTYLLLVSGRQADGSPLRQVLHLTKE